MRCIPGFLKFSYIHILVTVFWINENIRFQYPARQLPAKHGSRLEPQYPVICAPWHGKQNKKLSNVLDDEPVDKFVSVMAGKLQVVLKQVTWEMCWEPVFIEITSNTHPFETWGSSQTKVIIIWRNRPTNLTIGVTIACLVPDQKFSRYSLERFSLLGREAKYFDVSEGV